MEILIDWTNIIADYGFYILVGILVVGWLINRAYSNYKERRKEMTNEYELNALRDRAQRVWQALQDKKRLAVDEERILVEQLRQRKKQEIEELEKEYEYLYKRVGN